jgi:putative tryptophan/tyrosine transport system substrate-binding protein
MNRRVLLGLLAAVPWCTCGVYVYAQNRVPRIGLLERSGPSGQRWVEGFQEGLHELGYFEGKNVLIESRRTLGHEAELRPLAAELVQTNPDVIVTISTPAAHAALEATKTIPVVFIAVGDPVGTGLVPSLARPGGNGTGVSVLSTELGVKRLDLLRQLAPRARRVASLVDLVNPSMAVQAKSLQAAARSLGMELETYNARNAEQIGVALRSIPWKAIDGVIIGGDPIFMAEGANIAKAVRAAKAPAIFPWREFHEYGVLMSYGPNLREVARRGALYVDKILKGAKPADLPVEQVTKVDLVIDLRVAHETHIKVPQQLLLRADEVIQ